MNIYINQKEIEAVTNAVDEVNSRLESCDDEDSIKFMREIVKRLTHIERKYYKIKIRQ